MTHVQTVETLALLRSYFADRALRPVAAFEILGRNVWNKIRRTTRSETHQQRHREDFADPESERVLDAIADALLGPLALQAARDDDEAEWLASQQGYP
jgi:hypothetical protein